MGSADSGDDVTFEERMVWEEGADVAVRAEPEQEEVKHRKGVHHRQHTSRPRCT